VDSVHEGEIDDQPVVAGAQPRAVVAAAAHSEKETLLAGEADGGDDVGDGGALDDEGRVLVDHGVVDGARRVIPGIIGLDERAAHGGGECRDGELI
jgi:hypothetical protein